MSKKKDQTSSEVQYASFTRRLNASVIDSLLFILLLTPFRSVFEDSNFIQIEKDLNANLISLQDAISRSWEYFLYGGGWQRMAASSAVEITIVGVVIVVFWIYRSATPGKILLSMKVVDVVTNEKPSNRQLIIRYLGYFVSSLPLLLGFMWIAFDKRRQGWHDKMAGTAVIMTKDVYSKEAKERTFKLQTIIYSIVIAIALLIFALSR